MTALDGVNGTVCNATQFQQFLLSLDSRSPSISCLTHWDIIGLVLAAEASFLSFFSDIIILIWIGWNVHWYRKRFPNRNWKLFQEPADIYMFSLFAFEILPAMGGILNIKWAHDGIVTTGHYCTAQGIIKQIGDLGVALITLFLAGHTFVRAVLPAREGLNARVVALSLLGLACVFITLWVAIGASKHKNYETPTPYWCWISPQFPGARLGGVYIWMWIALFASVMLYIPLYFWAEGFWSIDDAYKFHWSKADQRVSYLQRRVTLGMLLYPLAYSLVILPLSITRWRLFTHHHVSSTATFFAASMFHLSGAINVALFLIIRPERLLFPRPEQLDDGQVIQLVVTPQGDTGTATSSDATKLQNIPEPTSAALNDGGPEDCTTPSHGSSSQTTIEI